ncbi:hypothetical protein RRG08_031695 [Elysia crispata]|uniref:UMA domain-containing protein n=1 Tax=Elysia crispata TaxID=231223 RepID=A0AAE1DUX1_9GAST|nr:hypothetical protein RRG08_031695 [Elysia crispata]
MQSHFDEARYQTIGRVHGFTELNGVPFKIADKYDIVAAHSEITSLVENLQISSPANALAEAASYTFDLERRVIQNMEAKWNILTYLLKFKAPKLKDLLPFCIYLLIAYTHQKEPLVLIKHLLSLHMGMEPAPPRDKHDRVADSSLDHTMHRVELHWSVTQRTTFDSYC